MHFRPDVMLMNKSRICAIIFVYLLSMVSKIEDVITMMKLSTMQTVVATVNEQWESSLADELLKHWQHDEASAKYWRASANFVFFFKGSGEDYVLRFNHADERTAVMLQAEVAFINHLAAQGIQVATPVRSLLGNFVESVSTAQGLFHAVVWTVLPGEQVELDEVTPEQFGRWGQALGELHSVSASYSGQGERPTWEDQLDFVAETLPKDEKVIKQALAELTTQLRQLTINEHNFGLIHADFELDNIIWNEGQPGMIDFDDTVYHWFVADIALALSDLFGGSAANVDWQNDSLLQFVEGYRSARPFDSEELKWLPLFLRLDHLISFAKLQRALTPTNPLGEPPWLTGLRSKLAAKMQFYRDEFDEFG